MLTIQMKVDGAFPGANADSLRSLYLVPDLTDEDTRAMVQGGKCVLDHLEVPNAGQYRRGQTVTVTVSDPQ